MTGGIPPGANRASSANCVSAGELQPPGSFRIGWVLVAQPCLRQPAMNSWVIWSTCVGCSQVMQCSTLVAAQGGWLCRSPATSIAGAVTLASMSRGTQSRGHGRRSRHDARVRNI
jgi:hypothetical protein